MMDTKAYRDFFKDSVAGQKFIAQLEEKINDQHKKAEDDPALARDYTQRAKGIREVLASINMLTVTAKKGKNNGKTVDTE